MAVLSPKMLLAVFTMVNVLTYFDRGALSAALESLGEKKSKGGFDLNSLQQGILGGGYMIGYVTASPIFAHLAHTYKPLHLMATGLFVWCLATAGSGMAVEFYTLLVARSFTGVGEASFLCLAPPFIDQAAPPQSRSEWLAIFFSMIPIGYALGTGVASAWISHNGMFGASWSWRSVFIGEALLMLPFVILSLAIDPNSLMLQDADTSDRRKEIDGGIQDDATTKLLADVTSEELLRLDSDPPPPHESVLDKLRVLWNCKIYVFIVLAYAAQTFVTGGFAYWGVSYAEDYLHYSKTKAGVIFGGVTAAMGLVGTAFGGWILGYLRRKGGATSSNDQATTLALRLVFLFNVVAMPAAILAFLFATVGRAIFFILLAVSEFFIFSCFSPVNSAIMWALPSRYGPIAMAMSVVGTHVLGDAASPVIIGALLDMNGKKHKAWTLTMTLTSGWLIWCIAGFGIAWWLAGRKEKEGLPFDLETRPGGDATFGGSPKPSWGATPQRDFIYGPDLDPPQSVF